MIDEIWIFIYSNWQNIIVALAVGLLFYFLSNYALKRVITSAERERLNLAKNSLLDILEARIINKQDISTDKINNLTKAIEREHSVGLSDVVSPLTLLQDIELRFEKSHHLDPAQKEQYCERIQNQMQEIRANENTLTVPRRYSDIVDTLTEEIKSKNNDKALENLELLKKKIKEREEYSYGKSGSFVTPITILIALFVALFLIKSIDFTLLNILTIIGIGFIAVGVLSILAAFVFGMGQKIEK